MFNKILVPTDGSQASLKAFKYAESICKKYNAKLVLLNVKQEFPWTYEGAIPYIDNTAHFKEDYSSGNRSIKDSSFKETYGDGDVDLDKEFKNEYGSSEKEVEENDFKDVYAGDYDKKNDESSTQMSFKVVNQAEKFFVDSGLEVETMTAKGDPASTILEIAENQDFDMIIMCTHGMSIVKRFALGSVTNKVVHHSNVPVLVIRESEDDK